jgi:hypothetical protein
MSITIRPATVADLGSITELLLADAKERSVADPRLWRLADDAQTKIYETIKIAMEAEKAPFRQQWLVAELGGKIVGVTHSILLPVPPIYAGRSGPPGLIMEDCYVSPDAPEETQAELLIAAETDLIGAGALILLASSVVSGTWERKYGESGYAPLTAYYAKTGLSAQQEHSIVRSATEMDVPGIVAASAVHRRILDDLHHVFWEPHPDADARFGAWMTRSLTLSDRDMFVAEHDNHIRGYSISHPATPLHFPTPHDISGVGVIDDFYHEATQDKEKLAQTQDEAKALFSAAEAARAERGNHSVLVVCPAHWTSKIKILEQLGYRNAITWHIKTVTKD